MVIVHATLAGIAVGSLAFGPRSPRATAIVALTAGADCALGTSVATSVRLVVPLLAFLAAALTLAAQVERSGLVERIAVSLAASARGNGLLLYVLVCGLCCVLTAAISLDGAVVVIVPVLLALRRRTGASLAPLFLGAVVVANAVSIAVPQGNPTNLLIINRLGLSAAAFSERMLLPGLAAAAVSAVGVAFGERAALAGPLQPVSVRHKPLSPAERHAAGSLAVAAAVAWAAPLAGVAPWWPFTAVVAVALATRRQRLHVIIPWRLAIQVGSLLIVTQALGLVASAPATLGLPGMLAVASLIGGAAAIANNLPVSAWASGLLTAGGPAYAASIGLAVGSLATPHGSVATLIASELAGSSVPALRVRCFAPLAAAGVVTATIVLWATG